MFIVSTAKFKEGKAKAWTDWWANDENVAKLQEALVPGEKFIGAYVVINNTADHDVEVWYEIDNWAVMDAARGNKKVQPLLNEFFKKNGFVLEDSKTKFLRTVKDVIIFEPEE